MGSDDNTLKQINRSGFPFQLRIEHEIRTSQAQHEWKVASSEHPWRSPDREASGFIDLVLSQDISLQDKKVGHRLVIECKRNRPDDRRHLQWLFLLPDSNANQTDKVSCLQVGCPCPNTTTSDEWKEARIWEDVQGSLNLHQSEFCILQGDEENKRPPILESRCAALLDSIDGLAEEEVNIIRSQRAGQPIPFSVSRKQYFYIFPAIVTNANLKVCRFNPSDIAITDGTLAPKKVQVFDVPYILFRKSLVVNFPEQKLTNLREANRARERSVLIINAGNLVDFLKSWKVSPFSTYSAVESLLLPQ